jgi:RNA polymerase sigma factor (sigma-70 family)
MNVDLFPDRFSHLLDTQVSMEAHEIMVNLIVDPRPSPEKRLLRKEQSALLQKAIRRLEPRSQMIVQRRFGFGGTEEETLQAIADSISLSKERVRQIENQTLKQLRHFLGGKNARGK